MPMRHKWKRGLSLWLLIVFMFSFSAVSHSESLGVFFDAASNYEAALRLVDAGRYLEARNLFAELGTYLDSVKYTIYLDGIIALSEGNLEHAEPNFAVLQEKGFLDSAQLTQYVQARMEEAAGDLSAALALYQNLDVLDSVMRQVDIMRKLQEGSAAPEPSHDTRITKIAATYNGCFAAIDSDSKLYVWGDFFGSGTWSGWGTDVPKDLPPIVDVGVGTWGVVALDASGKLHAWGCPENGETDFQEGLPPFAAVSVDGYQTVARAADGKIYAWGNANQGGQKSVPSGLPKIAKHETGAYIVSALDENGNAYEWGHSNNGKLDFPVQIVDIAANAYSTIALGADGNVYGADKSFNENSFFMPQPERLIGITKIFAGNNLIAAIDQVGRLYVWGNFSKSDGDHPVINVPTNLPPIEQAVLSHDMVMCLGTDGKLYGWGPGYDMYKQSLPAEMDGFSSISPAFLPFLFSKVDGEAAVSTEEEFYEAVRNGYKTIRCTESFAVTSDVFAAELTELIIEEGVTFTYSGYNFELPEKTINHGEIIVDGRMSFRSVPDKTEIGHIRAGNYGEIEYRTYVNNLEEIAALFEEDSIFNSITVWSAGSENTIMLESDLTIPHGFTVAVWSYAVLYVAEGVTLTVEGCLETISPPVEHGIIDVRETGQFTVL